MIIYLLYCQEETKYHISAIHYRKKTEAGRVDKCYVYDKLNEGQHDFGRGRSCLSQILEHYNNILHDTKDGGGTHVIYLEFSKAFNKVHNGKLLHKLKALGIQGKTGMWLHSFLQGCTQAVMVNGFKSCSSTVLSSVPRSSGLGPLLFLIMIGDIHVDVGNSRATSSTDDEESRKVTSEEDAQLLQRELNTMCKWANPTT